MNKFPVSFKQMTGLSDIDETETYLNSLEALTPLIE
jgi:hypothetical protein